MAPAHAIDGPDAHDHATKQLAPELTIDGPQQDGYSLAEHPNHRSQTLRTLLIQSHVDMVCEQHSSNTMYIWFQ